MSIFKAIETHVEEFLSHIEALLRKHFPHATDEQIAAIKQDAVAPIAPAEATAGDQTEAAPVAPAAESVSGGESSDSVSQ